MRRNIAELRGGSGPRQREGGGWFLKDTLDVVKIKNINLDMHSPS